jgi:hypothetical protein
MCLQCEHGAGSLLDFEWKLNVSFHTSLLGRQPILVSRFEGLKPYMFARLNPLHLVATPGRIGFRVPWMESGYSASLPPPPPAETPWVEARGWE